MPIQRVKPRLVDLDQTPLTSVAASDMPAGSVIKSETKIISAFGNTTISSANTFQDLSGTEVSFTRSVATSKILGLWNVKGTTGGNIKLRLNRKIGSGSYAVVNNGASGTQSGRTSAVQVWGAYHDLTSVNAMAYGIHAFQYTFLDESGEGLSDTTDAISYKISLSGSANTNVFSLNIDNYNNATNYNKTTESSVTFLEIKV